MSDAREGLEDEDRSASFSQMPILLFIRGIALAGVVVGAVAGLHVYLGLRLLRDAGVPSAVSVVGWTLLALLFLSIPLGFAGSRVGPRAWTVAIRWVSYLWLGCFGLLLVAVAASDVLSFAARLLAQPEASARLGWGQVQAVVVMALVVPALVVGFLTARGKAHIERVVIPIEGLPPAFEGLRIVQLSDVHIGETLDGRFLQRVVDQVNALSPDVVAITGDLVDGQVRQLRSEVAPLAGLKARRGVFFVTGNHEYYHGGPAWEAELRRLGLTVLHNEHRVLREGDDALVIAGITDHDAFHFGAEHASRPDLALKDAPTGVPRVLLAHQPRSVRALEGLKVDLQLSGHTHGGQMFPWMFFVRLQQPVISGLHTLFRVQVYTSRGTGYWGPPIRLGPKPEISELTLRRA